MRPVVIALDEGGVLEDRLNERGIEYETLGGRRWRDPRFHLGFASVLRRVQARVVHTHMFAPLLHSLPAVKLARVKRLVHTEHSFEYLEPRRSLRTALRVMSGLTHRFTVVGERMRSYYLDAVGVSPERLQVIVNGIDAAPTATIEDRVRLRTTLGVPLDTPLVGAVGRLAPEKNLRSLLRAIREVLDSDTLIHLALVGEGEDRAALEQFAAELGITNAVSFLGWRSDARYVLNALDIYALPSFSEGLPLALLEAMAAGLPVLCAPVGDVPFMVTNGENGFLVDPRDHVVLGHRLRELATNAALRGAMGRVGREVATRRYDRATMIQRYVDAYGL